MGGTGGRLGCGGPRGCVAGVLGHERTSGDGERRGVADGGARVPEVLTAVELEGIVAGVVRSEHHAEDQESPGL